MATLEQHGGQPQAVRFFEEIEHLSAESARIRTVTNKPAPQTAIRTAQLPDD